MAPKIFLVTGTSSGIGRCLVEEILARGDIAVAGLRTVSAMSDLSSKYGKDKLLVVKLDITNENERIAVFEEIQKTFGKLDVLINNAGIVGSVGELESHTSDKGSRNIFETNFWATLEMTKLAIEFMRGVNKPQGGKILEISSFVGYANFPGSAMYNASKAALESAIASWAPELDPAWNIKIVLVEAGQTATNAVTSTTVYPVHPAYANNPELPGAFVRQLCTNWDKDNPASNGPAKTAKVILKVAHMDNDKVSARVPVGSNAIALIKGGCNTVIEQMDQGAALAAEADGRD